MLKTGCSLHFRPSRREGGNHPGKLYFRVTHRRKSAEITTKYSLHPGEWDERGHCLILPDNPEAATADRAGAGVVNGADPLHLVDIADAVAADLKRLSGIIHTLEASRNMFTAADVCARFAAAPAGETVGDFVKALCESLESAGRFSTANAYRSALSSFRKFCKGRNIALADIDADLIRAYDNYLMERWREGEIQMNTVSFYLRILRAARNRAIREGLIPGKEDGLFDDTHTGIYETNRRAIPKEEVRDLVLVELSLKEEIEAEKRKREEREEQPEEHAGSNANDETCTKPAKAEELLNSLNFFMFAFYARGMSFVDMARLRKWDIRDGHIRYIRCKTGRQMEVAITGEMQRIIDYFTLRTKESPYLFPILNPNLTGADAWRQYKTALKRQNEMLKTLANRAGIHAKVTSHVARHTWATLAKYANCPVSTISEALGHRDVRTTEIYLASFDRSVMDELSNRIEEVVTTA